MLKPVADVQPGVYIILMLPIPLSFARVDAPTSPVPLVKPFGVRMSAAYFSWNLMTAALVSPPKYLVSIPFEPTPDAVTIVSALPLRTVWRFITSWSLMPIFNVLVKVYDDDIIIASIADATAGAATTATRARPRNPVTTFAVVEFLKIFIYKSALLILSNRERVLY